MFSRHERDRLQNLEAIVRGLEQEFVKADAQRESFERALLIAEDKYDRLLATHTDAIRAFQKVAAQYTDGLTRARETISELSVREQQATQAFRNTPLHMSEEEEDLEFQLDHGVIDMSQYNEALRMAGLADD